MTDTQAQEAARLAALLDAEQVRTVDADVMHSQAAALLRSQAARIAELEKASERITNNRDMWKGQCERQAAELARMREPLSDEQIKAIGSERAPYTDFAFARAIEAAHGITNTGEQQ